LNGWDVKGRGRDKKEVMITNGVIMATPPK